MGIDIGEGNYIAVEDRYMRPTAEYPDGSYLQLVDGEPMVATGYYATIYPDKPSLYFHGGAPVVILDTSDWELPWEK